MYENSLLLIFGLCSGQFLWIANVYLLSQLYKLTVCLEEVMRQFALWSKREIRRRPSQFDFEPDCMRILLCGGCFVSVLSLPSACISLSLSAVLCPETGMRNEHTRKQSGYNIFGRFWAWKGCWDSKVVGEHEDISFLAKYSISPFPFTFCPQEDLPWGRSGKMGQETLMGQSLNGGISLHLC